MQITRPSTAEEVATLRPARRGVRWRDYQGALFILPWFVGFILFNLIPFVASLVISLTNWNLVDAPEFVGLDNYVGLFRDELFLKSLANTAYYTIFHVPGVIILSFAVASLLNTNVRGLPLFRTCFYLPAITSGAATAIIWLWLFQPQGLINQSLSLVGISGANWLGSTTWSMPSLILMSFWNIGTPMLIFLAGLQGVPQNLYDAASVDGATWVGRLRHVTIPMVTPYIFLNAVLAVIGSFQVFTAALLVTNGGPANSTVFLVLYMFWNGWSYFRMGYASAIAWMLLLVILALTVVQFWAARRWVYYEAEARQ